MRAAWHGPAIDWPDRIAMLATWGIALLITGVFAWIVLDLVRHGVPHLSWSFLTQPPSDAGRAGGIGSILVSTLLILGVCLAVSLPIGVGTAVLLAEFSDGRARFARNVRRSLDILAWLSTRTPAGNSGAR